MHSACAILPSVACPALQYFATSNKRRDFLNKKTLEYKNVCSELLYDVYLKYFSFEVELSDV